MFYSQFILAKKGPLGTIWIAAHLERKLRKNQVADTDIGVSVDSIICPEVPIALRLSSHLMLGVVRIYSRKVNYLFHDCSEALLKVKQAFRSAAVDLPPEESTAPYHSITLPETFDLDDFELPDNAIFDGNFVDHHVSTREQITLQDTMNGTMFSTTQFGLDERFGDGDASQIGLDLDEGMFLEKSISFRNSYVAPEEKIEHHTEPETLLTNMDVDNSQDGFRQHDHSHNITETPKDLPNTFGYNIRTPDLNEMFSPAERTAGISVSSNSIHPSFMANNSAFGDHSDHAQAPPTPGLLEEVIPVHIQEVPDMSQLDKPSPSNYVEEVAREAAEVECQHQNANIINGRSSLLECSVGGGTEAISVDHEKQGTFRNEVIPSERVGMKQSSTTTGSQGPLMNDQAYLGGTMETPPMKTPVYELYGEGGSSSLTDNKPVNLGLSDMKNTVLSHSDKPETHPHISQEPAVCANSSITYDSHAPNFNFQLRPCFAENPAHALSFGGPSLSGDSHQLRGPVSRENAPDASGVLMKEQGEGFCSANLIHTEMQMHTNLETPLQNSALNKEYNLAATSACIRTANLKFSASSEYPESERTLRAMTSEHGSHLQQEIGQSTVENRAHAISFGNSSLLQSDIQMHKKLGTASLENSAINREYNLISTSAIHTANLNRSAGSEYREPERTLRAKTSEHGLHLQRDLGRSIMENRANALSFDSSSLLQSDIQMHKNLETSSLKNSSVNKESNLPTTSPIQTTNLNFSASSEYTEPERMLRTTASEHNLHLQQDIGQSIMENRVQALSVSGSSLLQSAIQLHKKLETPSSENSTPNKEYNLPTTSASIRTSILNCSASCENEEPGRMLRPTANQNGLHLQRDVGQPTVENRAPALSFGGPSLLQSDIQMHKSLHTASGNSAFSKEYNLPSTSAVRTANLNFSASSEYPEPERMLRATGSEHGLQRDIGQSTVENRAHALSFGSPSLVQSGIQMHKNLATSSLENSALNKEYNLPATSAIRTANVNYSASSGYPEPERMLRATASEHGLQRDIGQSMMDRAHAFSFGGPSLLQSGIQMHKNLGTTSLENSTLNKEYNLPATSVCIQTENLNCSASSEYPEPERMLRATASERGLQQYMEQSTMDSGVIEFDGSVDRLQTLSGKKRPLMDSTPTFFNENSMPFPGPPKLKKNTGRVPGDDDLLASILAGRTTPSLKVKTTPTLPAIPPSKRSRLTSKTATPKRKVLLDDTMVLHADTIRQQLLSTEDIRRVRKKAPCTRSDMWRMQKCLLEDELFGESTLTGISDNLTLLHYRVYNLNDTFRRGIDSNLSPIQISEAQTQTTVPPAVVNLKMSDVPAIKDTIGNNLNPEFLVPPAVVNLKISDVPGIKDTLDTNVNPECPVVGNLVHERNFNLVENSLATDLHQDDNENLQDVPLRSDGFSSSITSDLHAGDTRFSMLPYKGVVAGYDQGKLLITDKNKVKEPSVTIPDGAFHQSDDLNSIASDFHDEEVRYRMNFSKVMAAGSDQYNESALLRTDKHTVKEPSVTTDSAHHQSNAVTISIVSDLHDGGIRRSLLLNQGVVAGSDQRTESASLLTDNNKVKQPLVPVTDTAPHQTDGLSCSVASDLHDEDMRYNILLNKDLVAGSDQHIESASLLTGKDSVKEPSVMVTEGPCLPQQNPSLLPDFPVDQAVNYCSAGNLNTVKDIHTVAESRNDIPEVPLHSFHADKPDINENSLEIRKEDIVDHQNESLCQLPPETAANDEAMEMEFGISRDGQLGSSHPTEGEHVPLCQLEPEAVTENGVSNVGETSGFQEVNIAVPALVESHGGEAKRDSYDGGNPLHGERDSEFLNVGDEVNFDDDNHDVPNHEEAQSQDNSGWSARTRGVARYLKLLFDEDTGHTREVVPLDRLLSGKTRKEASRMFFETLVLKTKDYIHVEQESSFANIDIKPRLKLLKLEFQ